MNGHRLRLERPRDRTRELCHTCDVRRERSVSAVFDRLSRPSSSRIFQGRVHSDTHGLSVTGSSIDPDMPFHGASIGKTMTATMIHSLSHTGELGLDDRLTSYIPAERLAGLFASPSDEVTIRDLLGHTSGVADYAEGTVLSGPRFRTAVRDYPNKMWEPHELLDFTALNQKPVGPRGTFSYSDTGYVLLGLIVEHVTGMQFSKALETLIFQPLGMDSSYLMFGHRERTAIAPARFGRFDVSDTNILSIDWAGGGVVTTTSDLVRFQRALWAGELIDSDMANEMAIPRHRLRTGITYGLGMMNIRLGDFYFPARKLPPLVGHLGILGTSMLYDRDNDVHYILNFGSTRAAASNIRALIALSTAVRRTIRP